MLGHLFKYFCKIYSWNPIYFLTVAVPMTSIGPSNGPDFDNTEDTVLILLNYSYEFFWPWVFIVYISRNFSHWDFYSFARGYMGLCQSYNFPPYSFLSLNIVPLLFLQKSAFLNTLSLASLLCSLYSPSANSPWF